VFNQASRGVQLGVYQLPYVHHVLDESATSRLPGPPASLVGDPDVEQWLDDVAVELQRLLDQAAITAAERTAPLGDLDAQTEQGAADLASEATLLARSEANELRAWSRREAGQLVDETRRQVLEIYERLRLGVLDLAE
jgi:hypothetical protein